MSIITDEVFIVAGIVSGIVGISTIIWSYFDRRKQKIRVEGLQYRKEYGLLDITKYTAGVKSANVSRKQKNGGTPPQTFNKKIQYVDHFGLTKI